MTSVLWVGLLYYPWRSKPTTRAPTLTWSVNNWHFFNTYQYSISQIKPTYLSAIRNFWIHPCAVCSRVLVRLTFIVTFSGSFKNYDHISHFIFIMTRTFLLTLLIVSSSKVANLHILGEYKKNHLWKCFKRDPKMDLSRKQPSVKKPNFDLLLLRFF